MSTLESNDALQDRGIIKVTDGTYTVDITENGELKVTDSTGKVTIAGKETAIVADVSGNQLIGDVLKEMKKINFQLSLLTDTCINNSEV